MDKRNEEREKRLAEALRANLRKRKGTAAARQATAKRENRDVTTGDSADFKKV